MSGYGDAALDLTRCSDEKVGTAGRHADDERRAIALLALDLDGPAMHPHQFLDEGQPDTRAFEAARPRAFDAAEPVEQVRNVGGGDAGAGVAHPSSKAPGPTARSETRSPSSNVNLNAFDSRLRTICSHIARSTYSRRLDTCSQATSSCEAGLIDQGSERLGDLARQRRNVGRFERRLRAARFDPREIEQRVHQPQQALRVPMDQRQLIAIERRVGHDERLFTGPSRSVSGVRNS